MLFIVKLDLSLTNLQEFLTRNGITMPTNISGEISIDKLNLQKLNRLAYHDDTKITKIVMKYERQLSSRLYKTALKIQKSKTYNRNEIEDTFRSAIEAAYIQGGSYTTSIFKTTKFLTSTDIRIIKALAVDYSNIFVNNVEKTFKKEKLREQLFNNPTLKLITIAEGSNPRIVKLFNYMAHANSAIFEALQLGTIVKSLNLIKDNQDPEKMAYGEVNIFTRDVLGVEKEVPKIEMVYYFVTMLDERVCPYCIFLSKVVWKVDKWFRMPLIPYDTHANCRCRIMLKPYKNDREFYKE